MSTLLDTKAVADRLGVGHRTVIEYLFRSRKLRAAGEQHTGTRNFPEPDHHYAGHPVWEPSTIEQWEQTR